MYAYSLCLISGLWNVLVHTEGSHPWPTRPEVRQLKQDSLRKYPLLIRINIIMG